jgi:hypothetical protein
MQPTGNRMLRFVLKSTFCAVIASAVIALSCGLPIADSFQTAFLDALAALASIVLTGYVANTKPDRPVD